MAEYLQRPLPSDLKEPIREQLENREDRWLDMVRRAIFEVPENPYARMFALADCSHADLVQEVGRHGIEATLKRLRAAGVHLTHDEFKGATEIVRASQVIEAPKGSFVNPLAWGWFGGSSGGSRSAGTVTLAGTEHLVHLSTYQALAIEEYDLKKRAYVIVRPTLPAVAGMLLCVLHARLLPDCGPWFSFGGTLKDSAHYRALTRYIVAVARWHGGSAPWPRTLPHNDFLAVAQDIADRKKRGVLSTLQAVASTGVRVAAAALEANLDISETVFISGGEALTEGKRRVLEAAGIQPQPSYWVSEIGQIGQSCNAIRRGNEVHIFEDSVGVINHPHAVPGSDRIVPALLLTSLFPFAPHVLINVEMADAGEIVDEPCDCTYSRMGFHRRIRNIFSYGKLTGQGMTLVGTDIVRILEIELPEKFGGSAADYQLVEREGPQQTELALRVRPTVPLTSKDDVREYFLRALRSHYGGALASRVWDHSEAFSVEIGEPLENKAGKILPLHLDLWSSERD